MGVPEGGSGRRISYAQSEAPTPRTANRLPFRCVPKNRTIRVLISSSRMIHFHGGYIGFVSVERLAVQRRARRPNGSVNLLRFPCGGIVRCNGFMGSICDGASRSQVMDSGEAVHYVEATDRPLTFGKPDARLKHQSHLVFNRLSFAEFGSIERLQVKKDRRDVDC